MEKRRLPNIKPRQEEGGTEREWVFMWEGAGAFPTQEGVTASSVSPVVSNSASASDLPVINRHPQQTPQNPARVHHHQPPNSITSSGFYCLVWTFVTSTRVLLSGLDLCYFDWCSIVWHLPSSLPVRLPATVELIRRLLIPLEAATSHQTVCHCRPSKPAETSRSHPTVCHLASTSEPTPCRSSSMHTGRGAWVQKSNNLTEYVNSTP